GRREHPRGALGLVNAAQALQPRRVDQVLLRGGARHTAGAAFRDPEVAVDRVAEQVDARVLACRVGHVSDYQREWTIPTEASSSLTRAFTGKLTRRGSTNGFPIGEGLTPAFTRA